MAMPYTKFNWLCVSMTVCVCVCEWMCKWTRFTLAHEQCITDCMQRIHHTSTHPHIHAQTTLLHQHTLTHSHLFHFQFFSLAFTQSHCSRYRKPKHTHAQLGHYTICVRRNGTVRWPVVGFQPIQCWIKSYVRRTEFIKLKCIKSDLVFGELLNLSIISNRLQTFVMPYIQSWNALNTICMTE